MIHRFYQSRQANFDMHNQCVSIQKKALTSSLLIHSSELLSLKTAKVMRLAEVLSRRSSITLLLALFPALFHSSAMADWKISVQGKGIANGQAADPSQAQQEVSFAEVLIFDELGNYRKESYSTYPGDITFRFLDVGNSKGGKSVDIAGWRGGTETGIYDEKTAGAHYASMLMWNPSILVKVANEKSPPANSTTSSDSREQTIVDPIGRKVLLKRDDAGDIVEARIGTQRYEYVDYAGQGDLRHPGRIKLWRGDQLAREVTGISIKSEAAKSAQYQLPAGYDTSIERSGLKISQVAGNLYRIGGSSSAYHMAFAIGDDGIVLFDTPVNKQEGEAMRRLITEKFPGKKVTDVVISHGHIDHQAGLVAWLDMKPQIWTGAGGRAALIRNIPAASDASIQELSMERDLVRGQLKLRLLPVRSTHAHDMLVAFFPESRAVLQGDMFMVPEKGPAAAYPLAEHLQTVLREAKFEPDHIISVHGRVASAQDLAASVALHKKSPTPNAKSVIP